MMNDEGTKFKTKILNAKCSTHNYIVTTFYDFGHKKVFLGVRKGKNHNYLGWLVYIAIITFSSFINFLKICLKINFNNTLKLNIMIFHVSMHLGFKIFCAIQTQYFMYWSECFCNNLSFIYLDACPICALSKKIFSSAKKIWLSNALEIIMATAFWLKGCLLFLPKPMMCPKLVLMKMKLFLVEGRFIFNGILLITNL